MLLNTPGRLEAIANISKAAAEGRFNDKTEPFDPQLPQDELKKRIFRHVRRMWLPSSLIKKLIARRIVDGWRRSCSEGVDEIVGMEKLAAVKGAAFLTCNHFNPFDNGVIRTMTQRAGRGHLWALSQGTNFCMDGVNGFVLRNIDVIPLIGDASYMNGPLRRLLRRVLNRGRFILIYPEQEMWFNYRKPRPGKRGAFLFAAQYGVPVIPCFVEMRDLPAKMSGDFHEVKLILHILDPIFPDPAKTERQNSLDMCAADYAARVAAYEKAYGKPLTYDFSPEDIAGWIPLGEAAL